MAAFSTYQSEINIDQAVGNCKGKMARPRTLDRDAALDAAEALILEYGGREVTLDAVASRAGVSKGGLVYTFGNKDGLIRAALERELSRYSRRVEARLTGTDKDGAPLLRAFTEEILRETTTSLRKVSFLMTGLIHAPEMLDVVRDFYARVFARLDGSGEAAPRLRLLFFALEGASLLRGMGIVEMKEDEWQQLLRLVLKETEKMPPAGG